MFCLHRVPFSHPRRLIAVFVARLKTLWIIGYPKSVMLRLWSDCTAALADLSLRSAHIKSCTQQAHNVQTTSLQRRCNVVMLQQRCNDVAATLCVSCVGNAVPRLISFEPRTLWSEVNLGRKAFLNNITEPLEENCNKMARPTSKGLDQHAHTYSLIRTLTGRWIFLVL